MRALFSRRTCRNYGLNCAAVFARSRKDTRPRFPQQRTCRTYGLIYATFFAMTRSDTRTRISR